MLDSCSEAATECPVSLRAASTGCFRPRAVRRAIEYIHANLADSVRLEDIAGAVGLSVFHFSRTFRDTTGLAPHRYLTGARIERSTSRKTGIVQ
jgi:AraC-like DNA-binding protein